MFRVRCFAKISIFRLQPARNNCEAPNLQARPGKSRRRSSCSTPVADHLAMTELGVALLTVTRTFRCVDQRAESRTRRLVVSRPRASCDAGLLMPRCVSRASRTLSDARSPRVHPLRTLRCSEDRPTTVHRPQTDGHAPCSSLDAHVVLAFTVLAPAPVLRRSRPHPLRGPVRRPPPRFRVKTSLVPLPPRPRPRAPGRAHLPCLPCSPLDDHGQHSIGSQPTGSRIRVTFRREPATILFLSRTAPAPRTRPSRPPSPRGDDVCPAVGPAIRSRLSTFYVPQPPTMILADPRRACIHLSLRTGSCCDRIDLHLSTLTIRRHFRAHVRATCS
jgi:hypothetical protein